MCRKKKNDELLVHGANPKVRPTCFGDIVFYLESSCFRHRSAVHAYSKPPLPTPNLFRRFFGTQQDGQNVRNYIGERTRNAFSAMPPRGRCHQSIERSLEEIKRKIEQVS